MVTYTIPIYYEPFEKQKKAAKLLHLLAAFLMIANAWGNFHQPTPSLLFVLVQISVALLTFLFVVTGTKIFPQTTLSNTIFRLTQAFALIYASFYFFQAMHLNFMGILQLSGSIGLFLLLYSERSLYQPSTIVIDSTGVRAPANFGKRLIEWSNIENMRIRNDYISINTRQNQFVQFETNAVLSELEMDQMNAFCIQQFTVK